MKPELTYVYKTLMLTVPNKNIDRRRRYGAEALHRFVAGPVRLFELESIAGVPPQYVVYFNTDPRRSSISIGPMHPSYPEVMAALAERQPSLLELLEEHCLDAMEVLARMDRKQVEKIIGELWTELEEGATND